MLGAVSPALQNTPKTPVEGVALYKQVKEEIGLQHLNVTTPLGGDMRESLRAEDCGLLERLKPTARIPHRLTAFGVRLKLSMRTTPQWRFDS